MSLWGANQGYSLNKNIRVFEYLVLAGINDSPIRAFILPTWR